jgi:2-polyprenyl-3-methyl-5-hydroxy-6-metoxy-1,4-benzoquinol methylase
MKSGGEFLLDTEKEFEFSHTPIDFRKYQSDFYEINRVKIIDRMIPEGQQRVALDIACGPGYFSQILSDKGWKTISVDADGQNIESARSYASEVYLDSAISFLSTQPKDKYEFVLALELIEHMPKSHGETLVKSIRRVLKPGGTLIISTPNKFSLKGLKGYYWGEKIRGRTWHAWDRTHVHIYSSGEIIRLIRKCRLSVQGIMGFWYEGALPLVGQFRPPVLKSVHFPFNRIGFNTIVECRKK